MNGLGRLARVLLGNWKCPELRRVLVVLFNVQLGAWGFKQQPRHNFTFYVFRFTGSLVPLEIGIIKSSLNMRL